MSNQHFTCYWLGYMEGNTFSLADIPEYIDTVNLFLINIDQDKVLNYNYITSQGWTWQQIQEGVSTLQSRGQKVLASLMSEPQFNFNQISNPTDFADKVSEIVFDQWNLDGINIDPEMGGGVTPNKNFIDFVSELRESIGDDNLLTYVSYVYSQDKTMLQTNLDNIDWISLMGYFWSVSSYEQQWNTYKVTVPESQLLIGVKPGMTSLIDSKTLAAWQMSQGGGGMMEFQINSDDKLEYAEAIHSIIS